jgi:flavin-dependent dehydrogenase
MSSSSFKKDIVIAGAGVAAAAVAMRLLNFGFRPFLLSRGLGGVGGIEAIPESALRLFDALELTPILQIAGGVWVEGFENAWHNETVIQLGRYIHIERASLARAAIALVIDRGGIVVPCNTLPHLSMKQEWVEVTICGVEQRFAAAIDATGRPALWSRPTRRHHREIAEIFSIFCNDSLGRGRIARIPGGWAYRLGLRNAITVGVVTSDGNCVEQFQEQILENLCLPQTQLHLLGRRPAFLQWAEEPIKNRRVAVGDAALAYNPIAGQGIRFALSSALAATAVVRTWEDSPDDKDYATQYYHELVNAERQRHLSNINFLNANEPQPSNQLPEPFFSNALLLSTICYSGRIEMKGLCINGLIKCCEAIALPDGNTVRWLGNFDLLTLRELCKVPVLTSTLIEQLSFNHISQAEALYLIRWCLERNILSSC